MTEILTLFPTTMAPKQSRNFFKRRSAHGFFSSTQYPTISSPKDVVKLTNMGDMANARPASAPTATSEADPAPNGHADEAGDFDATGEPFVQGFQGLHSPKTRKAPEPEPRTPIKSIPKPLPLGSHPVVSSDEEISPAPPDFTRRGIHIPTRTR